MIMKRFIWVITVVAWTLILGNARAQDPALVDAKHYRVELENDQVRVLRARYGPGEKSVMHAHPGALAVFLTDAFVKFTFPDGRSQVTSNKAGTAMWTPATVHQPENLGDQPLEVMVVELKTAALGVPNMPKREVDAAIKRRVEKELTVFTQALGEKKSLEKQDLFGLLTEYLKQDPDVYGAAFAFTPQVKEGVIVKAAPYVYRNADVYVEKDLIENYEYTAPEQAWYAQPMRQGKPFWSKPYYDKGGGDAWMITYSVPLLGKEHQVLGIVRSDVLLPIQ
jgi:quercetin dioxygenase-like cupin family protein